MHDLRTPGCRCFEILWAAQQRASQSETGSQISTALRTMLLENAVHRMLMMHRLVMGAYGIDGKRCLGGVLHAHRRRGRRHHGNSDHRKNTTIKPAQRTRTTATGRRRLLLCMSAGFGMRVLVAVRSTRYLHIPIIFQSVPVL